MEKSKKLAEVQGKILAYKNEILEMKNTYRAGTALFEKERELKKLQAQEQELKNPKKKDE